MAYGESVLMDQLMLAASNRGDRLWRNNAGAYQDPKTGQWVKYGVAAPGGSDLIGFTRMLITPDDVGKTWAVFQAIEVKTGKVRVTPAQEAFIQLINRKGGSAEVYRG